MPKSLGLNFSLGPYSTPKFLAHKNSTEFGGQILQSPTESMATDIVEDLPAPEVEKPKYGGDEVALDLAAEMHRLEVQVQELREKAEKADERAMKWDKIRSECSQNNQQKSCQFAQQQYATAQNEAREYRRQMTQPEEQVAIRRDILAQFKDEDDLSETEMQLE